MMKPEQAKKLLEKWDLPAAKKEEDWQLADRYRAAVKKLPAKLKNIGFTLIDETPGGKEWSDWDVRRAFLAEQKAKIDKLTAAERTKIFSVFFGKLAKDVELAWQHIKSAPIARGLFRTPKNPRATLAARWSFIENLIQIVGSRTAEVQSTTWMVTWVPFVTPNWRGYEETVGQLAAAVITNGPKKQADAVFDILMKSATKEHEVGVMGRHIAYGLLGADRVAGWELMEKLLLAAQRQEGLRQALFQAAAQAHPNAFIRALNLIVEHKLDRFSSVVQAMNHWFDIELKAGQTKKIRDHLVQMQTLLTDAKATKAALNGNNAEAVRRALWALAFRDADRSLAPAIKLTKHKSPEHRFVAIQHLASMSSPKATAARVEAMDDEDLRIAWCAVEMVSFDDESKDSDSKFGSSKKAFETLERLLYRFPAKPTTTKPFDCSTLEISLRRDSITRHLLNELGDLPPTRLIPHFKLLSSWERCRAIEMLAETKKWNELTRQTIVSAVGDSSADVRRSAMSCIAKSKLKPEEILKLEAYLSRTSVDLRTGVIDLLVGQSDKLALESGMRLLQSKKKNVRHAGLELLRQLATNDRERDACITTATAWNAKQKSLSKDEQAQIDGIMRSGEAKLSSDNALGLFDPADLTPTVAPKKRKAIAMTAKTAKIIKSLDDLVQKHRKEEVTYFVSWSKKHETTTLNDIGYWFPSVKVAKPIKPQIKNLPMHETWKKWYESRPAALKDADGFDLIRVALALEMSDSWRDGFDQMKKWEGKNKNRKAISSYLSGNFKKLKLKHDQTVSHIVDWLLAIYMPKGAADYTLDVVETMYASVPDSLHEELVAFTEKSKKKPKSEEDYEDDDDDDDDEDAVTPDWRSLMLVASWNQMPRRIRNHHGAGLTTEQQMRQWRLAHWFDKPIAGVSGRRPAIGLLIAAYNEEEANIADVTDELLGSSWRHSSGLESLTKRFVAKEHRTFTSRREIETLIDNCRDRVLEVELARGESKTIATQASLAIESYNGMSWLFRILRALGTEKFKQLRGWNAKPGDSREATFTQLVGKTYPGEKDTPAQFSKEYKHLAKEGFCDQEKLLQLAFLAPQWTDYIEAAIKWDGFTEGLYWFMAHMATWGMDEALGDGDEDDDIDYDDDETDDVGLAPERLTKWERIIRERTDLTAESRSEGAIDVNWFHRTFESLKAKRFQEMAAAAKFAASSQQAKKAQLIADVLVGKAKKTDIVAGIRKKKLKEYVRLIGLMPLAPGAKRDKDLLDRYEILQEYRRYANGLSSMSRPEALRSCEIGMQNLASTAGFSDPMRLQWTLEAESTKDLAAGPVAVSKGDVSLTLTLDEQAVPSLAIQRGDKTLKSLPKTVNKDKNFVALRDRHKHLKRQASRVKASLQEAMCRGDQFTGGELATLSDHAILWPQLARLILVGEGIMGYPDKRGKALRNHAGKLEPVKKNEQLRVAHPHDLLKGKAWRKWQHECFLAERLQPFKQVFRELYVVTPQEKKATESTRYAGQQVNQKQAFALWGSRGWSVDEYGSVFKAFPDDNLSVSVEFDHGITTPLEVEGLTIESISFQNRDKYENLKLPSVDPRLFSEVMRDMDLVVSVAHVGEVDPEATESTVEMRTSLLRETCQLLGIKNVKFKDEKALIAGSLGKYTVHLGSGVVHRMPGGSVCIVPVHSQHRGRLFLPFADDDPRTAEVISKTLLLARDEEIDDPIILEQLRGMA